MRQIKLTKGKYALVDDQDYEGLSQYRWQYNGNYATRSIWVTKDRTAKVSMHRVILPPPPGKEVDHMNGDKLDNRRANLRVCLRSENHINKGLAKNNTSGYKGVSLSPVTLKWMAYLWKDGKNHLLGSFKTKELAAKEFKKHYVALHGEFAQRGLI